MTSAASPGTAPRRRRCVLPLFAAGLAVASTELRPAWGAPPCDARGTGWCVARRIDGIFPRGELGFRFGEPLDADGDGQADIAAGARFRLRDGTLQSGHAAVWSGADGSLLRAWDGDRSEGLFGHWTTLVPDLSGDGLADVVIAAPHAPVGGRMLGVVVARSPKTDAELWRREEHESENLGWDLALAGDQDGDGYVDVLLGAPGEHSGRVYLASGRDGRTLATYAPQANGGTFGWYVARLDDLDGDGRADLAVGGPSAANDAGARVGSAWVLSAASGKPLHRWTGTDPRGGYGGVLAPVPDLDGDGRRDLAIAAPATEDQDRRLPGTVHVRSTRSGAILRAWSGRQPGELFGRMLIATDDLDGDGIDDLAIGAPWYRHGAADRTGRVELRSGRTGTRLAELIGGGADAWFGWHIRRAPDPEHRGRPALLVGSLRRPVDGQFGVGVVELYVLRPGVTARPRAAHDGATSGRRATARGRRARAR